MFTACELCVCATYSAVTGTSFAATAMVVTAIGAGDGATFASLPHPASQANGAAAASNAATARSDAVESCLIWGPRESLYATCCHSTRRRTGRTPARGVGQRWETGLAATVLAAGVSNPPPSARYKLTRCASCSL